MSTKSLRPRVAKIVRLGKFASAFYPSNPFRLNSKDRKQLRAFMKTFDRLFTKF